MRRALTMAERLQAGTVWVNTYRAVSYLSPFGGYKRSGLGRESGQDMIKEYLQMKSVWISTATDVPNPVLACDEESMAGQMIGFVGVGRMGGPMACGCSTAGHSLTVFDTSARSAARR